MGALSTIRRTLGRARRLSHLAAALLLAALVAIPTSTVALAQSPPSGDLTLVNWDREFVERKKNGKFVARPVFDRKIVVVHYAVRDADTGAVESTQPARSSQDRVRVEAATQPHDSRDADVLNQSKRQTQLRPSGRGRGAMGTQSPGSDGEAINASR